MQPNTFLLIILRLWAFSIASVQSAPTISSNKPHINRRGNDLPKEVLEWNLWQNFKTTKSEQKVSNVAIPDDTPKIFAHMDPKSKNLVWTFSSDGTQMVFDIQNQLGSGAFGQVYSARLLGVVIDECTEKQVYEQVGTPAVKFATLAPGEALRGARLAKAIKDENVLSVQDYFYNEQYKEAVVLSPRAINSLQHLLPEYKARGLSREVMNHMFQKILHGVQTLHTRAFVMHRDIKTENILMFDKYQPRIADFDSMVKGKESRDMHIGTAGFLAPEVLTLNPNIKGDDGEYTQAIDVFSLGMVYLDMTQFYIKDIYGLWMNVTGNGKQKPEYVLNVLEKTFEKQYSEIELKLLSNVLCGENYRIDIDQYVQGFARLLT